ncbi:MAG: tRNA 2-thiouridine(34) synthase MnmA [Erysipelotrichaceae bacterium]|jgi:tRNA-specific 2-thiouridylase|nr:tRNA 2-thiouridine(34) synthase MnmA [Erysipelotrichaceae bacterium]HPY79501.1 tRNA 2-thiouridine(34) synthase MnmA [Bacilli bacterium]HQA55569.1 tRNA 2-thiouridine(34) synthase MnmA [Bacilli bacterium]
MKVLIGLSGGVDSAVAAYLLQKQGYEVTACFMRNWDALANNDQLGNPTLNDPQCPQEKDYDDAVKVAEKLGIELLRIDFVKQYWDDVFTYLLKEYQAGRTPNPDIFCNKYIKFGPFLDFAKEKGFDLIAMGHYAKRIDRDGKAYMLKSFDRNKDQTYFLSQISQYQLSSCLFPLGDIDKTEVRRIARELGLESVMDKKDSTGICFIGERHFRDFLMNYLPAQKGKIIDIVTKRVLGDHVGAMYYTLGQRKGLGIGGISGEEAKGWFVVNKDIKKNILYVASGEESEYLYSDSCTVTNLNFITAKPVEGKRLSAKFRYRQADQSVTIHYIDENKIELIFDKPYKAVTPGQAAVLYDGDVCLGGGLIEHIYRHHKQIDI